MLTVSGSIRRFSSVNEIGPLLLVIHVVQNRHVGEQGRHWDNTNKELAACKLSIRRVHFSSMTLKMQAFFSRVCVFLLCMCECAVQKRNHGPVYS